MLSAQMRSGLAADGLLYTGGCAIVAAPLAGVAVVASRRAASLTTGRCRWDGLYAALTLVIAAVTFATTSSVITFAWRQGQADATAFVLQSHLTLLAVVLALAAWGALCAAWCENLLDAAAFSLVTAIVAACGMLVAGATVGELPQGMIALGLYANPFVVITSAAQIDVVRMDLLYRISPLAHMRFEYPAWESACGWYLVVACVCFLGLTLKCRIPQPVSTT
jgi:hypothetical protein